MAVTQYHNFVAKAPCIGEHEEDNSGAAYTTGNISDTWKPDDEVTKTGDGLAFRFKAPVSSKISQVLFHVNAHASTDVQVDIRSAGVDDDTYGSIVSGGSEDRTIGLGGGEDGWEAQAFSLDAALTQNEVYWITLGVPPQGGGVTVNFTIGSPVAYSSNLQNTITAYEVTHVAGTPIISKLSPQRVSAVVIKFEDGTVMGCPYARSVPASPFHSNDVERGLYIEPSINPLHVVGVAFMGHANINKLRIYADTEDPGGTPLYTYDGSVGTDGAVGIFWIDPFTFKAGVGYRLAFDVSAATTNPSIFLTSEDTGWNGNQTALQAACFGGASIYYTYEDAGPVWVDVPYAWPHVSLILDDVARGGANRGILVGGRM